MSSLSKTSILARVRRSKESRQRLVASNLVKGLAFQLRATREIQGLTQQELAERAGMKQNNISRLESPEYGKYNLKSLLRLAAALDVALVVRFERFSQYANWISGTPYWEEGLRPEALAVPSFEAEEVSNCLDPLVPGMWGLYENPGFNALGTAVNVIVNTPKTTMNITTQGLYQEVFPSISALKEYAA